MPESVSAPEKIAPFWCARIKVDEELPMKEDYDRFLHQIIASNYTRRY